MRNRLLSFLPLTLLMLACAALHAQQDSLVFDEITLKSGTVIVGRIVEMKPNDFVKIANEEDGIVTTYYMEAVSNIRQGIPAVVAEENTKRTPYARLHLKDGTSVTGRVLEYKPGQYIRLAIDDNIIQTLESKELRRIEYLPTKRQHNSNDRLPVVRAEPAPYAFRETGFFLAANCMFSFGRETVEGDPSLPFPTPSQTRPLLGFSYSMSAGRLYSRKFGLGAGMGYDAYNLDKSEEMVNVFAHCRSYLVSRKVSPYVACNAGWGFGLRNKSAGITKAGGGLMLHPEAGFRLGGSAKTNFTIAAAMRLQWANWEQESPLNGDIEYRDTFYRRFMLNMGLLF